MNVFTQLPRQQQPPPQP
ncbi:unnamed protein product, partial [Rotaria sp. Silwood1]